VAGGRHTRTGIRGADLILKRLGGSTAFLRVGRRPLHVAVAHDDRVRDVTGGERSGDDGDPEMLKIPGRAAVVVPDNVLFEGRGW
jgi:hypothetical protein